MNIGEFNARIPKNGIILTCITDRLFEDDERRSIPESVEHRDAAEIAVSIDRWWLWSDMPGFAATNSPGIVLGLKYQGRGLYKVAGSLAIDPAGWCGDLSYPGTLNGYKGRKRIPISVHTPIIDSDIDVAGLRYELLEIGPLFGQAESTHIRFWPRS